METLKIIAAVAATAAFMLLIWWLEAQLHKSLRRSADDDYTVRSVSTPAELENAVRCLIWKRARTGKKVDIIINCESFDSEMLRMAQIFARECEYIKLE